MKENKAVTIAEDLTKYKVKSHIKIVVTTIDPADLEQ